MLAAGPVCCWRLAQRQSPARAYTVATGPDREGVPTRVAVEEDGSMLYLEQPARPLVVLRMADLVEALLAATDESDAGGPEATRAE